jgi:endonuclease G
VPYNPDFLGSVSVPLPALLPGTLQDAWNNGAVIDHTNYSLVFNQARELAVYTAANIHGEHLVSGINRRSFTFDPDVPKQIQIDNDRGYKGFPTQDDNPWDAGHLARRKDVHWPDKTTAKAAERDSSRWTNIAPQHSKLNQGSWRKVEDWLLGLADDAERRLSVFTGPVFTATDLVWQNRAGELQIRIPSGYWKIGLFLHAGQLRAAAFLIWQTDVVPSADDFDHARFNPVLEQVRVLTVEHLAGLSFGDDVRANDPLHFGATVEAGEATELTTDHAGFDLNLGGAAGAGPTGAPATPGAERRTRVKVASVTIDGPDDIVF